MTLRHALPALAISGSLTFAACGGGETTTDAAEDQATPAQAIAEIGQVRTGLDRALSSLKAGDTATAEETLSETYVEHFEKVEGPLGRVDADLNEELEEALSREIRDKVRARSPLTEVERLITEAKTDLAAAEEKLK